MSTHLWGISSGCGQLDPQFASRLDHARRVEGERGRVAEPQGRAVSMSIDGPACGEEHRGVPVAMEPGPPVESGMAPVPGCTGDGLCRVTVPGGGPVGPCCHRLESGCGAEIDDGLGGALREVNLDDRQPQAPSDEMPVADRAMTTAATIDVAQ